MKIYSSKSAQNGFGGVLKDVLKGAVQITKNGKPYAVIMTVADYQKLTTFNTKSWETLAREALKEGFLTEDYMVQWLAKVLNYPSENIEQMLSSHTNSNNITGEYEIKESTLKVSKQVKSFIETFSKKEIFKFLSNVMELKNNSHKNDESIFLKYDYGKFSLAYEYQDGCKRLVYIGKR